MNKLEQRALEFATKAHEGQVRKYTGEPYINHPIAVAEIVKTVKHTPEMVTAALLHDVVEDTEVTIEDVYQEFGFFVGSLVRGLTDVSKPEDGNRKKRKELDRIHLSNQGADVQTIKLADLINNTESITKYDLDFAKVYMKEKNLLLEILTLGDSVLHKQATDIVYDYYMKTSLERESQ